MWENNQLYFITLSELGIQSNISWLSLEWTHKRKNSHYISMIR
ncbi:hypothetical protein D1AOALGA4SA_3279 [Olavius algarvensis Delta 1 endosymbiont]|nr:hypothetical protein D1AOALGA4SA_3279 [Olavius algarvensis Delta 1 endosymbiont]